jgi:hypothetical protein
VLFEQRIAEDFLEVVGDARVRIVGERRELDVKDLRELDEQMRRQWPLIVLDEVQVTRRDLEPRREVRLRELLLAPEGADLHAQLCGWRHQCRAALRRAETLTTALRELAAPHALCASTQYIVVSFSGGVV